MCRVSSHLATMPISAPESSDPTIDLDPDIGVWEPGLTTVDLTKFECLSAEDQRRIIIRVLCGLVALEETPDDQPIRPVAPERPDPLPFTDKTNGEIDLRILPPPPPAEVAPSRRRSIFRFRRSF